MAYTFICGEDCSIIASRREVIMQREKCVSEVLFLVPPEYKSIDNDMKLFGLVMEYILPISRRYNVIELIRDDEDYKEYLQYRLPINTNLSAESGDVELQLTFTYVGLDADGKGIQKVRKTKPTKLHITPIAAWSDIVPDANLTALDQRIIATQTQINELGYYAQIISENQVDNLIYDEKNDSLQLMAGANTVGSGVSVKEILDDGIPVVDFGSGSPSAPDANPNPDHGNGCNCGSCGCEDNVVEFGYDDSNQDATPEEDDDGNVVLF